MLAKKLFLLKLLVFTFFIFPTLIFSEEIARLTNIKGKVFLIRQGKTQVPTNNLALYPNDTIKTLKNSSCEIFFTDLAITLLEENTQLTLKAISKTQNNKQANYFLNIGKVFSSVSKLKKNDSFNIQTPSAIAGIRGTEFLVNAENKSSEVAVYEGEVEVISLAEDGKVLGKQKIKKGLFLKLWKNKKPGKPLKLTARLKKLAKKFAGLRKRFQYLKQLKKQGKLKPYLKQKFKQHQQKKQILKKLKEKRQQKKEKFKFLKPKFKQHQQRQKFF